MEDDGGWITLHNSKIHNWHPSPCSVTTMVKGCNIHERERRGHEVLVRNPEEKRKLARHRTRLRYDIKI
jgi:hypothetical protein